ncbi:hypothetical protein R2Q81_05155 [Microbacterium aquimaris]|uniref:hypothetical protein n=1 Tax=Microbacterium aquimaris TaxID=459816 RepID=UPI002AD3DD74|nr:hypothetical protein [Microbacterium aquimaris]MDZ8275339.1 hypothetical protein [Microbacterium aquimaris]
MRTIFTSALAAAALVILAGCTAAPPEVDPSHLPDTTPVAEAPTPKPTETSTDSAFGERVVNDRGNLVKEIGQLAGVSLPEHDDVTAAQFAVTDVIVDIECSDYAVDPANGHYVGIHFNVETTPDLALDDVGSLSFAPWGWQAYGADGKRVNDPIGNSYSCLEPTDKLPSEIGPAQSVSGWVVLDLPTPTGSVVLTMGGPSGWEWAY